MHFFLLVVQTGQIWQFDYHPGLAEHTFRKLLKYIGMLASESTFFNVWWYSFMGTFLFLSQPTLKVFRPAWLLKLEAGFCYLEEIKWY